MIEKVVIQNYKIFGAAPFSINFNDDLNIIVGDNDSGKSTILEATVLALTGRLNGIGIANGLTPHLFNKKVSDEFLKQVNDGDKPAPPELIIDVFFKADDEVAHLNGTNNLLKEDAPGVRVIAFFNSEYDKMYTELIEGPEDISMIPTEYYEAKRLDFSGDPITSRSIPLKTSFIDASTIQLQRGTDIYLRNIIDNNLSDKQKVELAVAYRSLKETFANDGSIEAINSELSTKTDITDKSLSMAIDVTQKTSWETNLIPHLDDLPFQNSGKGEQNSLKILLALADEDESNIVLIEEPENHLSYSNLHRLIKKINDKCNDRQVVISTHSSYVTNKLGLDHLVLINEGKIAKLTDLNAETYKYFMKLSGYDTLRLVLSSKSILVEGPSDELIVQRAFLDEHDVLPIEKGVDVINVRGLSFKRFLDIAVLLKKQVVVITDNDGNYDRNIQEKYADYLENENIEICASKNIDLKTLEDHLANDNDLTALNVALGKEFDNKESALRYMKDSGNKTDVALAVFEAYPAIILPEYIQDAVK